MANLICLKNKASETRNLAHTERRQQTTFIRHEEKKTGHKNIITRKMSNRGARFVPREHKEEYHGVVQKKCALAELTESVKAEDLRNDMAPDDVQFVKVVKSY